VFPCNHFIEFCGILRSPVHTTQSIASMLELDSTYLRETSEECDMRSDHSRDFDDHDSKLNRRNRDRYVILIFPTSTQHSLLSESLNESLNDLIDR